MVIVSRINELEQRSIKLDKKDVKIISTLLQNARIPYTELAKKVMLSKDAVKYRINRLVKKGIILGFFPIVDFDMLGYEQYVIKLLLDESRKKKQAEFLESLQKHPNVVQVLEFSDRWDVEVRLIARDIHEFDKIETELTNPYSSLILQKEKNMVIRNLLSDFCPRDFMVEQSYLERLKALPFLEKQKFKLDKKGLLTLKELTENCRRSTYEIAPSVFLSADSVSLRIKKMLAQGLIFKFTIALNYSMLGYHLYSFEADMSNINLEIERKLLDASIEFPYIFAARKILGYWDIVIKIMVKSPIEFHTTVEHIKSVFSHIIRDYETLIVFKEHCYKPLPYAVLQQSLKA